MAIVMGLAMAMTSMQLGSELRDELAKIAAQDFQGVSLGEAVNRLVKEHKINRVIRRYEELRANPEEWANYQGDIAAWDAVTGDGLPDATGCARWSPSAEVAHLGRRAAPTGLDHRAEGGQAVCLAWRSCASDLSHSDG